MSYADEAHGDSMILLCTFAKYYKPSAKSAAFIVPADVSADALKPLFYWIS